MPRDHALISIDEKRLPDWPAKTLKPLRLRPLVDPRDTALSHELELGVVRNLLFLRTLAQQFSGRHLRSIDVPVQKLLCLGLYQIHAVTRVNPAIVVNETVEASKRFGLGRAGGFLNAVLRKAAHARYADASDSWHGLPIVQTWRDNPTETHARQYAEQILSHPPELFDRLYALESLTEPHLDAIACLRRVVSRCESHNRAAPIIARLLPGQTIATVIDAGVDAVPHVEPGFVVLKEVQREKLRELSQRGVMQVQDPTSGIAIDGLELAAGHVVLDRCAGRGTKTLQMAERVRPGGIVVAVDPSADRIRSLRQSTEARGIDWVQSHVARSCREQPIEMFDRVLIDAPCSNSGVLSRRAEARYSQNRKSLESLASVQWAILSDTANAVKPGGRLAWSTCSIWPCENGEMVKRFVETYPQFEIIRERSTMPAMTDDPTSHRDGGYVAVLVRRD
jgi:16S rRNA (cytosine967-C5)-methyltransferase